MHLKITNQSHLFPDDLSIKSLFVYNFLSTVPPKKVQTNVGVQMKQLVLLFSVFCHLFRLSRIQSKEKEYQFEGGMQQLLITTKWLMDDKRESI